MSSTTALHEERAPRRVPSRPTAVLLVVAVVAGVGFGVILASLLDVRPWLAAIVAAAWAIVIVAAGRLLLAVPAQPQKEAQQP